MMKPLRATRKIPKAQQEVLNWKQNLHEEIKNMTTAEGLTYLIKKGESLRCQKQFQTHSLAG
jgi:hypothetical protein